MGAFNSQIKELKGLSFLSQNGVAERVEFEKRLVSDSALRAELAAQRRIKNYLQHLPKVEILNDNFKSHLLNRALREDARAGFAYREARRVIALLVARYGPDALRSLLRELSAGTSFDDAFKKATDVNLAAFEARWLQDRADRRTSRFFAWLGANWFWLLFGSAGIFGAIAMFKRRGRDRARIAQWEETEKAFPSDPEWSYYEDE